MVEKFKQLIESVKSLYPEFNLYESDPNDYYVHFPNGGCINYSQLQRVKMARAQKEANQPALAETAMVSVMETKKGAA